MSGRRLASFSVNAFNNSSFYPISSFLGFRRSLRSVSYSTEKAEGSSNLGGGGGGGGGGSSRSSGKRRSWGRKAIHIGLISVAGGFALSAVNDVAIFHGCSSKAIEKASQNSKIVESIGVPIVRGPWYDASLAVGHRRNSVSCTFPVSGPQGSAIFQLKAIRNGEDGLFSFLRHHDWDILIMEALLHVPSNDEKQQTLRISLTADSPASTTLVSCDGCAPQEFESQGK